MVTGGSCGARPPSCSVVRVAPARRCGFAGAGPAAVARIAPPFPLRGGRPPGPGGAEGVGVSGQWLAGCGAAGSSPRSLSPHSLPREVARPRMSCHTVGGAWVRGPISPPNPPVPAVWAFTCAAACVGAGAAAVAGCAGGSASGRGRYAKPGGASCWRPHP